MGPAAKILSLTNASAEFIFEGKFEGDPVTWHCQLFTLASIAQRDHQPQQCQFIEILPQSNVGEQPVLQVIVGLNVAAINTSVIDKTIIMIRNYKRLHLGRHEYGDVVEFPVDN